PTSTTGRAGCWPGCARRQPLWACRRPISHWHSTGAAASPAHWSRPGLPPNWPRSPAATSTWPRRSPRASTRYLETAGSVILVVEDELVVIVLRVLDVVEEFEGGHLVESGVDGIFVDFEGVGQSHIRGFDPGVLVSGAVCGCSVVLSHCFEECVQGLTRISAHDSNVTQAGVTCKCLN